MPFDYPDDDNPRTFTRHHSRYFAIRLALHQYRTLPFEKLKYRNLREDFYNHGIVPYGYLSYCCSQKAPFREAESLPRAVDALCAYGDLRMLSNEAAAEHFDIKIDPKSTLYLQGDFARRNYLEDLEMLTFWNTEFEVPAGYPIHRLACEADDEARKQYELTGRSFQLAGKWVPRMPTE